MSSPQRRCRLQVPKMLGSLRHKWAPEAFLVSFKLETDEGLLISKVTSCTIHLHPLAHTHNAYTGLHQFHVELQAAVVYLSINRPLA